MTVRQKADPKGPYRPRKVIPPTASPAPRPGEKAKRTRPPGMDLLYPEKRGEAPASVRDREAVKEAAKDPEEPAETFPKFAPLPEGAPPPGTKKGLADLDLRLDPGPGPDSPATVKKAGGLFFNILSEFHGQLAEATHWPGFLYTSRQEVVVANACDMLAEMLPIEWLPKVLIIFLFALIEGGIFFRYVQYRQSLAPKRRMKKEKK